MKFEISGDVTHIPERRLANPFARDRANNVERSKLHCFFGIWG